MREGLRQHGRPCPHARLCHHATFRLARAVGWPVGMVFASIASRGRVPTLVVRLSHAIVLTHHPIRLAPCHSAGVVSPSGCSQVMSYYGAGHAFWSDVGQVCVPRARRGELTGSPLALALALVLTLFLTVTPILILAPSSRLKPTPSPCPGRSPCFLPWHVGLGGVEREELAVIALHRGCHAVAI